MRSSPAVGHDPKSGFSYLTFGVPNQAHPASAVVFLHGSGERGSDLSLVTRYGLPAMLAEGRAITNCAVICPQLEEGGAWDADRVAGFLQVVAARYKSVSLIGFSLGGSGVCNVTAAYGAVVTFAMAIAGQGPVSVQVNQVGVRLLAIQGELDPWPKSDGFLASVRSAGGQVTSVKLAGQDHYISEMAFSDPTAVSMLFEAGVRISTVNES
jgi:predicted esterase